MSMHWRGLACALLTTGVLAGCGGGSKPPDVDADGTPDALDCAASDASRWQLLSYASVDADADGRRVNEAGQVCTNASLPPGRFTTTVADADRDCDDADASRYQLLSYAGVDADSDTFNVASSGQLCAGATLPTAFATTAPTTADADCNDSNAAIWRFLAYASMDADGDTFKVNTSGQQCSGLALLPPFFAASSAQQDVDCDDANPARWRNASTYVDVDGDQVGSGAGTVMCIGAAAPTDRSLLGYDPLDDVSDPDSATVKDFAVPPWLLTVDSDANN